MNTSRIETFADGVFAIAATLLILNVDSQISEDVHDLGTELLHIWPSYLAYAVSFVTIGIMWINHHTVMSQIDRTDRRFLVATVGLLLCIAFVPFPTRLVAEHIRGELHGLLIRLERFLKPVEFPEFLRQPQMNQGILNIDLCNAP